MGLLKHLLFWPATGPAFLARYSIETVEDVVVDELTDDAAVKEELMGLQLELEAGTIDDDEYLRREGELMRRFREVREWRERYGMGIAGGPVRVTGPADVEANVENPADAGRGD